MWIWIGIIGILAVVSVLVWRLDPDLRRGRQYKLELARREPVSDDDLLQLYFAPGEVAPEIPGQVRRIFAKYLGYPAEKMLPDDDFMFLLAELDVSDLVDQLEAEFKVSFVAAETERPSCTIRAVALLVEATRAQRVTGLVT